AVQSQFKEIWDIKTLLETLPKLGAVIDLTNTSRYYNPEDLLKSGILYKKIFMPGRIIPPEEKVHEFMDAVDEFGKDRESLIGVHCTHGLNRTGYMVCRYMRDRMGFDAKDAIHKFEIARGYKIERDNYIAHLIGLKPPPPDLGSTTKIVPKSPTCDDHHLKSSHYNDRRKNGESERKSRRDEWSEDNEDSYHSGRYVRHPQRTNSRNEPRERSKHRRKNSSQSRSYSSYYGKNRNNSDSDSSYGYDYRHDY
ncbi:hypothetical protein evm_001050, partial [Chilo suppressalis]